MPLLERLLLTLAVLAAYAVFCGYCWHRHRRRSGATAGELAPGNSAERGGILVGYASQSGRAAELARRSARALSQQARVLLMPLNQIDEHVLLNVDRALFVASTYGEGEPPDNATRFAHRYLAGPTALDLSHLEYAVLALGDRAYRHFCGFGHKLHQGLSAMGARARGGVLEAEEQDLVGKADVLARWHHRLAEIAGAPFSNQPFDAPVSFTRWRLLERRQLNPGSAAPPLSHLRLSPLTPKRYTWQAGDIAEVLPQNTPERCAQLLQALALDGDAQVEVDGERARLIDCLLHRQLPKTADGPVDDLARWLQALPPLKPRQYSIASTPGAETLDLVVRQRHQGLASSWLTAQAPLGTHITLRIRSNPNFHPPEYSRDLLLIGAGSGIAGLRAHIQARAARPGGRTWLVFGERSPEQDTPFAEEIAAWQKRGCLERVDLTFSRGPHQSAYVQDALIAAAAEVKAWVEAGAAVYVCGSRQGMAEGVDTALERILGRNGLAQLRDRDRYRRDVY